MPSGFSAVFLAHGSRPGGAELSHERVSLERQNNQLRSFRLASELDDVGGKLRLDRALSVAELEVVSVDQATQRTKY